MNEPESWASFAASLIITVASPKAHGSGRLYMRQTLSL
jgi:hypothetical protein